MRPEQIEWQKLGFGYTETDYRYISKWENGQWDKGELTQDSHLSLSEAAVVLHYGQSCFEGLKAYRTKSGKINLFRPDMNAKRMQNSSERLLMPTFPIDRFIDAVKQVVKANEAWIPPYGTGGSLYIRPFMFGSGPNIGLGPAPSYTFMVFAMPVGAYFKNGLAPSNFIVTPYDRAAPRGTGAEKVSGNYAGSLLAGKLAKDAGYADAIYLDPQTHTKIEEVGAANFFGITKDNQFITPKSPSILPSITKYSLLYLAKERLGMEAIEGDVRIDELDRFAEAGACGTAAVISPVGLIHYEGKDHVFHSTTEVGPVTKRLYDELVGIQYGDIPAPEGWIVELD